MGPLFLVLINIWMKNENKQWWIVDFSEAILIFQLRVAILFTARRYCLAWYVLQEICLSVRRTRQNILRIAAPSCPIFSYQTVWQIQTGSLSTDTSNTAGCKNFRYHISLICACTRVGNVTTESSTRIILCQSYAIAPLASILTARWGNPTTVMLFPLTSFFGHRTQH